MNIEDNLEKLKKAKKKLKKTKDELKEEIRSINNALMESVVESTDKETLKMLMNNNVDGCYIYSPKGSLIHYSKDINSQEAFLKSKLGEWTMKTAYKWGSYTCIEIEKGEESVYSY